MNGYRSNEFAKAFEGDKTCAIQMIREFIKKHPPTERQTEAEEFVSQALVKVLDALHGEPKRIPDRVVEALSLKGQLDVNRELDRAVHTLHAFGEISKRAGHAPPRGGVAHQIMGHLKNKGMVGGLDDEAILNKIKHSLKRMRTRNKY